jgi:hypothetical protein
LRPEANIVDRNAAPESTEHAWLTTLVHELFQTERSAKLHPVIEAERLGDVPPARVLRAVAAHAELALAELPPLVKRHQLPDSKIGRLVGSTFSALRDKVFDLMLSEEKSYRGTLLGMRHGVDLVELIENVAREDGDQVFAEWCGRWLERRRALVEEAARELSWFARNPERARASVRPNPLRGSLRRLLLGVERLAGRVRHGLPQRT